MNVHLVAVQVAWSADLYATPERFRERMLALAERAVDGLDDAPRLLAFPELVALPLLLTASGSSAATSAPTFAAALARLARRDAGVWARTALRLRCGPAAAVYGSYALEAHRIWFETFAEVARRTRAVVVAGTAFLPDVDDEPSRGPHVRDASVHNVALTVSPDGRALGRTAKVNLTPGAERRAGLRRGRLSDLAALETPVGRVGVAVCLDGFHERVLTTLDGLGAQIVVQPSANDADWDRPWPTDPTRREGDVWLLDGLRGRLQRRASLRYGVNPMLVGDAFGLRPRGRSSIVANVGAADLGRVPSGGVEALPGVLALAPEATADAVVRVSVPHPAVASSRAS